MKANNFGKFLEDQNIDHAIFDLDKTIATFLIDWSHWNEGVYSIIKDVEPDFEKKIEELTVHDQNEMVKKHGVKSGKKIAKFNREYELKNGKGWKINVAAINALNSIKKQKVHLWTSNSKEAVYDFLRGAKLFEKFETIITRDHVDYIKPHPHGFDFIHDKKIPKEKYVMIGDSWKDEDAAKAAGIKFIHIDDLV